MSHASGAASARYGSPFQAWHRGGARASRSPSRSRSEVLLQRRGPDRRNWSRPSSRISMAVQAAGRSSRQRRAGHGGMGPGSRGRERRSCRQGWRSQGARRARLRPGRKPRGGSVTAAGVQSARSCLQAGPVGGAHDSCVRPGCRSLAVVAAVARDHATVVHVWRGRSRASRQGSRCEGAGWWE